MLFNKSVNLMLFNKSVNLMLFNKSVNLMLFNKSVNLIFLKTSLITFLLFLYTSKLHNFNSELFLNYYDNKMWIVIITYQVFDCHSNSCFWIMQQFIDLKRFIAYDSASTVKVIADSINIKWLFTKLWANKPEKVQNWIKLYKIKPRNKLCVCLIIFSKILFFMYYHQYIVLWQVFRLSTFQSISLMLFHFFHVHKSHKTLVYV